MMKTKQSIDLEDADSLPFGFKDHDVTSEQIAIHWSRIENAIKEKEHGLKLKETEENSESK